MKYSSFFLGSILLYAKPTFSFRKIQSGLYSKSMGTTLRYSTKKKTNDISSFTGGSISTTSSTTKKIRNISPKYLPKTANQEQYLKCLNDRDLSIVFGIGPAGCGKTLFACITAINELMSGNVNKIIITRPIVPVEEEEIGFLPGNLIHKMDPWTRPIFDILLEFYQQKDLDLMLHSGIIEISPLAYMRGRTFKRSFIIADEMQNSTPNQMLMLSTRIGEKTKLVVTGDLKQSDRSESNGLIDFINKYKFYQANTEKTENTEKKMIEIISMNSGDIRRSEVVSKIIEIYNKKPSDFVSKPDDASLIVNDSVEAQSLSPPVLIKKKNPIVGDNDCAIIPLSHMH